MTKREHSGLVDVAWDRGVHWERLRIRKAIAPALRELSRLCGCTFSVGTRDRVRFEHAVKQILAATRAPRRRKAGKDGT